MWYLRFPTEQTFQQELCEHILSGFSIGTTSWKEVNGWRRAICAFGRINKENGLAGFEMRVNYIWKNLKIRNSIKINLNVSHCLFFSERSPLYLGQVGGIVLLSTASCHAELAPRKRAEARPPQCLLWRMERGCTLFSKELSTRIIPSSQGPIS